MNTKKSTVATEPQGVHTSAQTDAAEPTPAAKADCQGCGGCGGGCNKPAHHKPSQIHPRDKYTGQGGRYVRNPETGERMPASTEKD